MAVLYCYYNTLTSHPITLSNNGFIFKLITPFLQDIRFPNIISNGYGSAFYLQGIPIYFITFGKI